MTDHPSTFHADPENIGKIDWDDRASLHRKDDGAGVLDAGNALRRGTLTEMIRHVTLLPAEERSHYVIQKAGDHRLELAEIEALAQRDDFPRE